MQRPREAEERGLGCVVGSCPGEGFCGGSGDDVDYGAFGGGGGWGRDGLGRREAEDEGYMSHQESESEIWKGSKILAPLSLER